MSTNSKQKTTTAAAYGSWKSPISAQQVASGASSSSMVRVDSAHPTQVYWLESRPSEGGRLTLLTQNLANIQEEGPRELTPQPWNVRTSVHEYGGAAYAVHAGVVVFANWADQGVYVIDTSDPTTAPPRRIGLQDDKLRYAGFAIYESGRFAVCVREDHRKSDIEAVAALVAIALHPEEESPAREVVLFEGTDFVSSPVLSPKNDQIAFITWNHPNMSWDRTVLHCGALAIGADGMPGLCTDAVVAGGEEDGRQSIYQPRFDSDGTLHFLSDRVTGFWNPHRLDENGTVVRSLTDPILAEFAGPEWAMGESSFQPVPGRKACFAVTYAMDGDLWLGILDTLSGTIELLPTPEWTIVSDIQLAESRSGEALLVLRAGEPTKSTAMFAYFINPISGASAGDRVLRIGGSASSTAAADSSLFDGYLSVPREIVFDTRLPPFDKDDGAKAYAYYYPPTNKDYRGETGTKPPLLVLGHGGPTTATSTAYSLRIQFWTSRGFAVADVNYGGSTGYGRAFRERLYPHFGQVDVQDCCAAALHLADRGLVDRQRLSIMGGSAGGYTTLACLAFRPEVFAVGASHYGMSDLEVLVKETHKFESRYPDHLVGPYPDARATYIERSPLHSADRLECPVIFFQGLEDRVVPPSQTSLMVDAMRRKGLPVAHVEFEGEQHGFRKFENIVRAMEAQLFFFGNILGFDPADPIEPVPIHNKP
ncbi:Esterase lipase thioesterase active site [Coemansia sp. RSA 1933]|nr:Esterase lipase thioesterase active site [Coemansia sp. RSA 1933]